MNSHGLLWEWPWQLRPIVYPSPWRLPSRAAYFSVLVSHYNSPSQRRCSQHCTRKIPAPFYATTWSQVEEQSCSFFWKLIMCQILPAKENLNALSCCCRIRFYYMSPHVGYLPCSVGSWTTIANVVQVTWPLLEFVIKYWLQSIFMKDLHTNLKSHPVFHYLLEMLQLTSISAGDLVATPTDFVSNNKAWIFM